MVKKNKQAVKKPIYIIVLYFKVDKPQNCVENKHFLQHKLDVFYITNL